MCICGNTGYHMNKSKLHEASDRELRTRHGQQGAVLPVRISGAVHGCSVRAGLAGRPAA